MKELRMRLRPLAARRPARRRTGPAGRQRLHTAALLAVPLLAALLLPLAVVGPAGRKLPPDPLPPAAPAPSAAPTPAADKTPAAEPQPEIAVYLSRSGQIERLPLEDYVSGVVAAEMPASFELEALKAQAVAARTFIVRRLVDGDASGVPVPGAVVTDTVSHQAYVSQETLEREWKQAGRGADLAKIRRAVLETRGTVMTYGGKPITAAFFSASSGYTENSEEYWNAEVPYLRSVASPWERNITPNFAVATTFGRGELLRKLGEGRPEQAEDPAEKGRARPVSAEASGGEPFIEVLSRTSGKHIKEIRIGSSVYTGREVRERLGLRSTQFTWEIKGDQIELTTYGNGHGVGMSQWGANGMAGQGATATQILNHYYKDISFAKVSSLLAL